MSLLAGGLSLWRVPLLKTPVMMDFMCPLGWAMVPRRLVKHYSQCGCEGVSWVRGTLKSVDFE